MKHFLFILVYCIASFLFLSIPSQAKAAVLFQDTFDNNNFSDWTVTRNFQWEDETQPCLNNNQPAIWQIFLQQLGIIIDGPGCFTEIVPSSFHLEGSLSYIYSFDLTMPESTEMDRNYLLRFVDTSNNYGIKILGDSIFLEKAVQGRGWSIPGSFGHYPFTPNTTYHIRNEIFEDHRIKVFINEVLVLNFVDTAPYLSGGTIGFRASVGAIPRSVTWFDNATVESFDDLPPFDVPYFSQRDIQWRSEEYDTASRWGGIKTTIQDWGCALTSAAMILRYYGIDTLPDFSSLTPSSLNSWLRSQPDGYLGDGFINWIAVTRLTKYFNDLNPETPLLEYKRKNFNLPTIQNQIQHKQPIIFEVPGHFLVGRGVSLSKNEFTIHDPYDQNHSALPIDSNVNSLRLFTPTHTNLSYILLVHDPNVTVSITNDNITEINAETFQENPIIEQETLTQEQHQVTLEQLSKPENGDYNITIMQQKPGPFTFTLFTYTKDGEVQTFQESGITQDNTSIHYQLHYSQQENSRLKNLDDMTLLVAVITQLRQTMDITKAYPYYRLRQDATYIQNNFETSELRKRYLTLLQYDMSRFTSFITPQGLEKLKQAIQKIQTMP